MLLMFMSVVLYLQIAGQITVFEHSQETIMLIFWISLALLPIVVELNLFGFSLKNKIERVEGNLKNDIQSLRLDMQNTLNASTNAMQNLTLNIPPQDSQLNEMRDSILNDLRKEMQQRGGKKDSKAIPSPPPNIVYLINVRRTLEIEVKRLLSDALGKQDRYKSINSMARILHRYEVIPHNILEAILTVYRTCSAAVHGEEVTQTQYEFVAEIAPELISTLQSMGTYIREE